MNRRWIETATRDGQTIEHEGYTIMPQAWSLTAAWPGGGWVWNQPRAVIVRGNGAQMRIPIHNVTLIVQLALAALVAVFVLLYIAPPGKLTEGSE